ncbi:MAG: twin-arginine translocase TatA/TatE family subunit [bacterium]|nr:twin-arginine translocase TatA/TatE family subunit [bacterium]
MFPSHWELLVIFLVVLLLFGAKRIPEMAKGLGKGIREFRSAVKDVQQEVDITGHVDSRPKPTIQPPPPGQVSRSEPVAVPVAAPAATAGSAQEEIR